MDKLIGITILQSAKNVLQQIGWCQGSFAKDIQGEPTLYHIDPNMSLPKDEDGNLITYYNPNRPKAMAYCLVGSLPIAAIKANVIVNGSPLGELYHNLLDEFKITLVASKYSQYTDAVKFNDAKDRTLEQVLEVINLTIDRLQK